MGGDADCLREKAAAVLGVRPDALDGFRLAHQSVDARKKSDIHRGHRLSLKTDHLRASS